jgi:hypothetical protein
VPRFFGIYLALSFFRFEGESTLPPTAANASRKPAKVVATLTSTPHDFFLNKEERQVKDEREISKASGARVQSRKTNRFANNCRHIFPGHFAWGPGLFLPVARSPI